MGCPCVVRSRFKRFAAPPFVPQQCDALSSPLPPLTGADLPLLCEHLAVFLVTATLAEIEALTKEHINEFVSCVKEEFGSMRSLLAKELRTELCAFVEQERTRREAQNPQDGGRHGRSRRTITDCRFVLHRREVRYLAHHAKTNLVWALLPQRQCCPRGRRAPWWDQVLQKPSASLHSLEATIRPSQGYLVLLFADAQS